MDRDSKIIGGLQLYRDIDGTTSRGHKILNLDSEAQILYSSLAVTKALDIAEGESPTSEATGSESYRIK